MGFNKEDYYGSIGDGCLVQNSFLTGLWIGALPQNQAVLKMFE
jgi:hypothetical protein